MGRSGDGRIQCVHHHIAGEGGDSLRAHRVSLIGHGRRTNLFGLKGLLDLLQMLQKTNVTGKLRSGLRDAGQYIQHAAIDLTRVGLTGYSIDAGISHLLSDLTIQRSNLLMISLKELQERSLGSRGTLSAAQFRVRQTMFDIFQIQQ